jgi:hypothetical protein
VERTLDERLCRHAIWKLLGRPVLILVWSDLDGPWNGQLASEHVWNGAHASVSRNDEPAVRPNERREPATVGGVVPDPHWFAKSSGMLPRRGRPWRPTDVGPSPPPAAHSRVNLRSSKRSTPGEYHVQHEHHDRAPQSDRIETIQPSRGRWVHDGDEGRAPTAAAAARNSATKWRKNCPIQRD